MRFSLGIILIILTTTSALASDWCVGADRLRLNEVERKICDTPILRSLDTQMASAYYARRDAASSAEKDRLRYEQARTWLPYRDACGPRLGCLANRYQARIFELSGRDFSAMAGSDSAYQPGADVTVTPEGYFARTDENGVVRLFDPRSGQPGVVLENGQIQWFSYKTQVNPVGLPALPGDSETQSVALASDLKLLSGMVLSASQMSGLEPHAPSDYLGFFDFYINAMIYFLGLTP